MKIFPTSAAVLLLAATATPLHAGGYVSAGMGGGAGLGGSLDQQFNAGDHSSGRFALGQRLGPVALEASLFGAGLDGATPYVGIGGDYNTLSLGVDLKYYLGLAGPLELYGKGGLNNTWLNGAGPQSDYDGRGWDLGGGLQFTLDLPITMAAVWLDYTHQDLALHDGPKMPIDGSLDMLSLGVSIGL
jgi:Outer membrane protein beta-barrel domain